MNDNKALEALNEVEKKQIELMDIKNIMSLWHPNLIVLFGTVLDNIKIVRTALVELAEIKKRAEGCATHKHELMNPSWGKDTIFGRRQITEIINYILKGEPK